jgi:hypothetical protein
MKMLSTLAISLLGFSACNLHTTSQTVFHEPHTESSHLDHETTELIEQKSLVLYQEIVIYEEPPVIDGEENESTDGEQSHNDTISENLPETVEEEEGLKFCLRSEALNPEYAQTKITKKSKVIICHIPPGNPAKAKTLMIGAPAVKAHLKHGDRLGACAPQDPIYEECQN